MGRAQSRPETVIPEDNLTNDPPFLSECEVLYEGDPNSKQLFKGCKKNPGHRAFIPVKEFTVEHLPVGYRTEDVMQIIKDYSDRTVKVIVKYTSYNRPTTFPNSKNPYPFIKFKGNTRKTRIGTGFVVPIYRKEVHGRKCPCGVCKISGEPMNEYREFIVTTAAHVVFDDAEAEKSIFELFYDSEEDRGNVKCLYGVRVYGHTDFVDEYPWGEEDMNKKGAVVRRSYRDKIQVLCVSHDVKLDLPPPVPTQTDQSNENGTVMDGAVESERSEQPRNKSFGVIIISHPHGIGKHITVGNRLFFNNPDPLNIMCHGSSDGTLRDIRGAQSAGIPSLIYKMPQSILNKIMTGTQIKLASRDASTMLPDTKALQQLKKLCQSPKSGSEILTLKTDLFLAIPTGSTYFCQRNLSNITWVTFPLRTRFLTNNGANSFHLPENTMFKVPFWDFDFPYYKAQFFETYDIDTCPGSSGAPLTREFKWFGHGYATTHSGALINGTNKCALEYL